MFVRRAVAMLAAFLAVLFGAGAVQASSPQAGTTVRAVRSAPPAAEAAPPAARASCTARNVSHYDAYTGRTWTRDWVCGNRAGAPLYGCASFIPAVDVWTSTDPWPGMTECNIP
ncbi:hypothetical protein [Streptomyces cinereoruber]|uniref:hypothetical protein n=1 Tax=Streptomyces cinereoruber TaxID=67260 RepID=UPI00364563F4